MPELRVVAVSNDGTRLVLKAADSTEYTLPIDERLRAAVRGDRPRLGQIEIEVESHLRPRDIQARIRAGASAEEVAQLAGIPVDRVRRFEGPVLAERAFMAERARKTPVRRPGETTGPQLGEAVQERLLLRGADKETVQWDSWRRDDGTWEVLLVYRVAGEPHSASWTYDPPRRLVQAVDEEARSLIGESDDDLASPEPSFPFVPRIARLPRDRERPMDRALERQTERPVLPPSRRSPRRRASTVSGTRSPASWRRCPASVATWWCPSAPPRPRICRRRRSLLRSPRRRSPRLPRPRPVRRTPMSSCRARWPATANGSSAPPTGRPRRTASARGEERRYRAGTRSSSGLVARSRNRKQKMYAAGARTTSGRALSLPCGDCVPGPVYCGSGPVATGRLPSADHCDHEPAYSAAGMPAT